MNLKTVIFFLPLFLMLLGCAATAPPVSQKQAPQLISGPDFVKLVEAGRTDATFKALARIEINSSGNRYPPLKAVLMLRQPSMMKIEVIPPIGPPSLFISVLHGTLKIFVPEKQKFYQGKATRKNLALFFPVSLSPEDMASILTGLPPGITDKNLTSREGAAGSTPSVDILSPDGGIISTLRIDATQKRLAGMDVFAADGGMSYTVSYEEYTKVENHWLPQRIIIHARETNTVITVSYSDMELSRETDETTFDLALPPGMKAVSLDTAGIPGESY